MRHALVSLIALAAASTPAIAQETAVETTTETTTVTVTQPAAPTPATAEPTATVTTTVTTPAETTVTTTVAAPVLEVAPAPALPPTPNDPVTLQVLNTLDNVCRPLVAGGNAASITKPLGFKKKREVFVLSLAKPSSITVTPSAANPNVCNFEVIHPVGGDEPITVGLHNWAIGQGYTLYRNDAYTTDLKRHTRSWERTVDGKTEALVLVTETRPDGSGTVKNGTRSTVMYSVR